MVSSLALAVGWAVVGNVFAAGATASRSGIAVLPRRPGPSGPTQPRSSALNASSDDELYADTCPSSSTCWAVGFHSNGAGAELGQALLFDGTTFSSVSLPEPGGSSTSDYDYLDAIACTSSSDCWTVGSYGNTAGPSRNEALYWDGVNWSNVATPQPAGTANKDDHNALNGVACLSSSDCWAVGDYTNHAGAYVNDALHWNGQNWTLVATPDPDGTTKGDDNVPYSVSCTSPTGCISVGYGHNAAGAYVSEALQWNGKTWTSLAPPQPGGTGSRDYGYLEGLACLSGSQCLAAGGYLNSAGTYVNQVLMWDGTSWTPMSVPQPDRSTSAGLNELTAISCLSASDCWAVGYYGNSHGAELNEALAWNGEDWSSVATPQPAGKTSNSEGNTLYGVSCGSSSYCLAAGYTFRTAGPSLAEALVWDGSIWAVG